MCHNFATVVVRLTIDIHYNISVGNQFGSNLIDNSLEVARIPARMSGSPSYIHSFGMSKNFIIFIEQPLFLDEDHVKLGCTSSESSSDKIPLEYPHRQNYTWKRGEMVRFYFYKCACKNIQV